LFFYKLSLQSDFLNRYSLLQSVNIHISEKLTKRNIKLKFGYFRNMCTSV